MGNRIGNNTIAMIAHSKKIPASKRIPPPENKNKNKIPTQKAKIEAMTTNQMLAVRTIAPPINTGKMICQPITNKNITAKVKAIILNI
jgi:hypothetical protein